MHYIILNILLKAFMHTLYLVAPKRESDDSIQTHKYIHT